MVHSEKFKSRMVSKMVGPHAISANALSRQAGVGQPTLSRWLRQARTVSGMLNSKKSRGSGKKAKGPSQDWNPEEKFRVVVESRGLSEEEFDEIFDKIKKRGLAYGSGPFSPEDMDINHWDGGRGVYFRDPSGHLLEILTRDYTPELFNSE